MNPKITSYIVFVHNETIGAHVPTFKTIEEAEQFANSIRAVTSLTVSEPIPVVMTESYATNVNTGD